MLNLDTLDTVIAIVVVLLVLSLIVQSIQSFIKKVLKMKSGTILTSLNDLFTYIDVSSTNKKPAELVQEVKGELEKIGRVSAFGNIMIDSIAKGDLEKILEKLGYKDLLPKVGTWFETVMQSFEERYTRHMKTVALILSFVVVIILNANFFEVYRKISRNGPARIAALKQAEEIEKRMQAKPAANSPEEQAADQSFKEALAQLRAEQNEYVGAYQQFGIQPFTRQQLTNYFKGQGPWDPHANPKPPNRLLYGLETLLGWAIMTLLLSVGAPFWQDTLESLFGLKNLLRQKTDTKNVEGQQGGQTKT
ncbi:MAG: hypothetical protein WAL47_15895 [Pyrinomonadaceae bacterium]